MTQKEIEDANRALNMTFAQKNRDLLEDAAKKKEDIEAKRQITIEAFNAQRDKLEDTLGLLIREGNELRRQGYAEFSKELDANRESKVKIRKELRELKADFEREMLDLSKAYKQINRDVQIQQNINGKLKAQSIAENQSKLITTKNENQ